MTRNDKCCVCVFRTSCWMPALSLICFTSQTTLVVWWQVCWQIVTLRWWGHAMRLLTGAISLAMRSPLICCANVWQTSIKSTPRVRKWGPWDAVSFSYIVLNLYINTSPECLVFMHLLGISLVKFVIKLLLIRMSLVYSKDYYFRDVLSRKIIIVRWPSLSKVVLVLTKKKPVLNW